MPAQVVSTDVWTFASLIEGRIQVTAHCVDCRFTNEVDLAALRDRLGADRPAMASDFKKLLHCPKCRGKRSSFIYSYCSGRKEMVHGAWAGRTICRREHSPGFPQAN